MVIAMAMGYQLQVHRRFVRSLRLGGYSGDIVVLCDEAQMAQSVRRFLKEQSVETVDVAPHMNDPEFKRLGLTSAKFLRYHMYAQVAKRERYRHGLVLLCDYRDVTFQRDPFARTVLSNGENLRLFLEISPPTIGHETYTTEWIESCWGEEAVAKIHGDPIICSGVTMGTPQGVEEYCHKMLESMAAVVNKSGCGGHDQRHHNWLYYSGKLGERVRLVPPGLGDVFNLGYIAPKGEDRRRRTFRLDDFATMRPDGRILIVGPDGQLLVSVSDSQWRARSPPQAATLTAPTPQAVLHQLDRHPTVMASFDKFVLQH